MKHLYIAHIDYFDEIEQDTITQYTIIAAGSYTEAARICADDFGEKNIDSLKLIVVDEDGSRLITKELADAFEHDLTESIKVYPSEWRQEKLKGEKHNDIRTD